MPKIRVVHLLCRPEDEREIQSVKEVSRLADFGMEYIQVINEPAKSIPHGERPLNNRGKLLAGHWGCFKAHLDAIKKKFDDTDYLLICEGDCTFQLPIEEVARLVNEGCRIIDDNDVSIVSFGSRRNLHTGEKEWEDRQPINKDFVHTNTIIGTQCVLIPVIERSFIINAYRTRGWHTIDWWYTAIFEKKVIAISKETVANQIDGFSLIDNCEKTYYKNKPKMIVTLPDELVFSAQDIQKKQYSADNVYDNIERVAQPEQPKTKITINRNFVKGAFAEVLSNKPGKFKVEFKNGDNTLYETTIGENCWAKCGFQYFIPYTTIITDLSDNQVILNETLDLKDKRVVIEFGSKSLGDTLAWLPYADEFQRKHNCTVIVVTFLNNLFEKQYPNLLFSKPGETLENINAWYQVGWFYDGDNMDKFRHPNEVKDQPMQKTASDILGLDFKELRPRLAFTPSESPLGIQKYVTIAPHSTAQIKYWVSEYWQELVDYLIGIGYEVVSVSREGKEYMGNKTPDGVKYPENFNLNTIMNYISNSDFFIGIGTGLTWLAWALNIPTVLISGFSEPYTEMQEGIIRISAPADCKTSGAFNKFKLNPGNWNWEPYRTMTSEYESSKAIVPKFVIEKIQPFIQDGRNL